MAFDETHDHRKERNIEEATKADKDNCFDSYWSKAMRLLVNERLVVKSHHSQKAKYFLLKRFTMCVNVKM
jgi:hypothetical protein